MSHRINARLLTAAVLATAIVPSAAIARPATEPQGGTPVKVSFTEPRSAPASGDGFAWGDAGLGAAAAVAFIGAGTAVAAGTRRRGRGLAAARGGSTSAA